MLAGAGMPAGVGDLNGVLVIGEADGIRTTRIGLVIIKAFIKVLTTSASDVTAFTLEQEEASVETVLITSTHVQESQDAVLMPILALIKLTAITAEEVPHLAEVRVLTMRT